MRTHVMRFSKTHKTVTELQIVDGVLGKKVPAIILPIPGAALRRIWNRVTHVPHVRCQALISDRLSDSPIMHIAHVRHDPRVEVTNTLQFITRDRKSSIRGALFGGWFWCVRTKGSWLGMQWLMWDMKWLVHN